MLPAPDGEDFNPNMGLIHASQRVLWTAAAAAARESGRAFLGAAANRAQQLLLPGYYNEQDVLEYDRNARRDEKARNRDNPHVPGGLPSSLAEGDIPAGCGELRILDTQIAETFQVPNNIYTYKAYDLNLAQVGASIQNRTGRCIRMVKLELQYRIWCTKGARTDLRYAVVYDKQPNGVNTPAADKFGQVWASHKAEWGDKFTQPRNVTTIDRYQVLFDNVRCFMGNITSKARDINAETDTAWLANPGACHYETIHLDLDHQTRYNSQTTASQQSVQTGLLYVIFVFLSDSVSANYESQYQIQGGARLYFDT
jgi:hypothetical protein